MTRHYLDHASTSALRPEARAAMIAELEEVAADPGRIHAEGMRARHALETARASVAALLSARPREVVFTSGATEAIVSAIHGCATRGRHIVLTAVEHSSVRLAVERLVAAGSHEMSVIGVDRSGIASADDVLGAVRPDTALVCVQLGNHEVGAIQPVADVAAGCRERGVLTLVDAAQAAGRMPIAFTGLGADLVAVSSHKLGGPPGVGALVIRRGLRIDPLLVGGDQERARRAGLENLPAAAGFAAACDVLAAGAIEREARWSVGLTDRVRALASTIEGIDVLGPDDAARRLPHLICIGVQGVEPQGVLLGLDHAGVACHSGSSCASESIEPSPVLRAMGVDADRSLRISVGWNTTADDIEAFSRVLPDVLGRLWDLGRQLP